jgi:alpha-mannosidase
LRIEGPAILDTVKPADDGTGVVLRFYEPHGSRGRVTVTSEHQLAHIYACNHVEEIGEEITMEGNSFSFAIKPFEIRSFLAQR